MRCRECDVRTGGLKGYAKVEGGGEGKRKRKDKNKSKGLSIYCGTFMGSPFLASA